MDTLCSWTIIMSVPLSANLLAKGTYCTETLRTNRKHLPDAVKEAKLGKGETVERYAKGVMVAKWRDKHTVTCMSTEFENVLVTSNNRRNVARDKLTSAEKRCIDLNIGFKDKSVVCCELEEQYDTEVNSLTEQLTDYKSENERLRNQLDEALDTNALIAGYEAKLTTLTAERKNLLTTMEVLEADVKCLRAKQRRSSAGDDILSEISMSEAICNQSPLTPGPSKQSCSRVDDPVTTPPAPPPPRTTDQPIPIRKEFNTVLIVGDSHLRHSTKDCAMKGAFVECCPGGKIVDIKNVLLGYVGVSLNVIYLHAGCNNLKRGYRGCPGYNGGHGKRGALHSMVELLFVAKTQFLEPKLF
ncbi:hypothetical protein J6590_084008 [Homalodisca vitripennis]|nr:hypothetical protein J6590_084008 [Homalodisca vitripennis]